MKLINFLMLRKRNPPTDADQVSIRTHCGPQNGDTQTADRTLVSPF